jgi:CubicO group peptidase (beta-lactamase class C family)
MTDAAAIVDEVLAEHAHAGLALAVVTPEGMGETVLRGVAGPDRPVGLDTVFRIGSVTKTMTALALLRQWEAGRFGLDDPVNDHLRDLRLEGRAEWRPATIGHLLTHTAGIGELSRWSDLRRPLMGLGAPVGSTPDPVPERYSGRLRLEVEPGTKWSYANHGFNVLGHLLETLTGEPLAEHLRSTIFEPLGMEHTWVDRTPGAARALATAYTLGRRGLKEPKDLDVEVRAAGSVFATLPDLAAYASALLDGGRGVVSAETLQTAFDAHFRPCATHPGIGLSFFRGHLAGHLAVGHGGGWPGFVTALVVAPDDGVGVVALTNGGSQAVSLTAHRVLCRLLGVPGFPEARPLRPERWAGLVGFYRPAPGVLTNFRALMAGGGVEIAVRRGKLVARALSPIPDLLKGVELRPADDEGNIYTIELPVLGVPPVAIHVEHDSDGRPAALHFGGMAMGAFPALHRASPWRSPRRRLQLAAAGTAAGVVADRVARRRRHSRRR